MVTPNDLSFNHRLITTLGTRQEGVTVTMIYNCIIMNRTIPAKYMTNVSKNGGKLSTDEYQRVQKERRSELLAITDRLPA